MAEADAAPGGESGREPGPAPGDEAELRWGTPQARGALLATVLGSGLTFLAATSINVALPSLARDLGVGVAGLQWTVNAYTLTLAALVLLGGSLGDRWGRRRVFIIGTVWLGVTSLLCGLAPDGVTLVIARGLQGVGAALLTPVSLAILQASFAREDRSRAVGAWSGLAGVATALGPLVGGWLVDLWNWRLIFLINVPLAIVVILAARRYLPETRAPAPHPPLDLTGAVLVVLGLAGTTAALTSSGDGGLSGPQLALALGGLAALVAFLLVERTSSHPMLPLGVFRSRQFTGANLVTLVVYGVLGGGFFVLTLQLQFVLGYSAVEAGAAELPVTILMLLLSARAGALAQRIGPRIPMTLGPLVIAASLLLLALVDEGSSYLTGVLPGVFVLGLGLSLTVAPLTATVLSAVDARMVGVASGINNAVARAASLITVAALPVVAGLGGSLTRPEEFSSGYRTAILITAGLSALGGLLAWLTIRSEPVVAEEPEEEPHATYHCAFDHPPVADRQGAEPST